MELVIFLVGWIAIAVICARLAQKKGRDPIIWGAVGFLTSLIGLIILALCEDKTPPREPPLRQPQT